MVWLKNIWDKIKSPYTKYKRKKALERKIAELQKRDPFIYK